MGTRTHDKHMNRRADLRPRRRDVAGAEHREGRPLTGAVEENRTPVASLARSHSTVELPPRVHRKKEAGRRAPRARTSCAAAGRRPASATRRTNGQEAPWGGPKGELPSGMVTHEHWPVRWSDEGSNLDPCRAKGSVLPVELSPRASGSGVRSSSSNIHLLVSPRPLPPFTFFIPFTSSPIGRSLHRSYWVHRAPFCGGA